MNSLALRSEPCAEQVHCTDDELVVVLTDGVRYPFRLRGFHVWPMRLRVSAQSMKFSETGVGKPTRWLPC